MGSCVWGQMLCSAKQPCREENLFLSEKIQILASLPCQSNSVKLLQGGGEAFEMFCNLLVLIEISLKMLCSSSSSKGVVVFGVSGTAEPFPVGVSARVPSPSLHMDVGGFDTLLVLRSYIM